MSDWWLLLLMLPIGAFCSAYGTLIGAGGGFLLVPILLFMFPHLSASQVTSISLAMAFFNAVSGSIPYLRLRRVDVRSAIFFATGTIPGAIIGVYIVALLSRNIFDPIFGILLALVGLWTFFKPGSDRAGFPHRQGKLRRRIARRAQCRAGGARAGSDGRRQSVGCRVYR